MKRKPRSSIDGPIAAASSRLALAATLVGGACGGPDVDAPPGVLADPVIYGTDGRTDLYAVTDTTRLAIADGTVAVFATADIEDTGDGKTSRIITEPNGPTERTVDGQRLPLCTSERFYDQPLGPWCSGFLVAPRIVATAGHCAFRTVGGRQSPPVPTSVVFGFRMFDSRSVRRVFDNSQIYRVTSVIGATENGDETDWGLYELDRPVTDHRIVSIRRSGKIADGATVYTVGHPSGLPAKVAAGATVRDNTGQDIFRATLDAYGGNSGSPVVNASSGTVEGILVNGEWDFVDSGLGCFSSKVCRNDGADCRLEGVNRTASIVSRVPQRCTDFGGQWSGCRGSTCTVCAEKIPSRFINYFKNHPNCTRSTACAGVYGSCSAACPPPGDADQCGATPGQWAGCRTTSGCSVCEELVREFPKYFVNHPNCTRSTACGGSRGTCSAACPEPTEADRDRGCGGARDALCCAPTAEKPEGDCGPDFFCNREATAPGSPGRCAR